MTHVIPEGATVKDVAGMPGVSDLPFPVRATFAQALTVERDGDKAKAEAKLAEAVAKEG